MRSRLLPCRYVVIEGDGLVLGARHGSRGLLYTHVETGKRVLGRVVVLSRPSPCFISTETVIKSSKAMKISTVKLVHNYVIEVVEQRSGRVVDRLVYPLKVWERIERAMGNFIALDRHPFQGILLYGPPGTGKTSAAGLVAQSLGLPTISVSPTDVLSKWLGESERNLFVILREAEKQEPCVLLVDDCEWLLLSRELKSRETAATTQLGVMKILLEAVERWSREGVKVFVVATTNAGIEILDQALLRSGRLGKPVYVPLPDFEAVNEFLVLEGVDEKRAREWAVKSVSMGLPMSDVKLEILPALLRGEQPLIEPRSERGYRRYVADLSFSPIQLKVERYFKSLDPLGDFSDVVKRRSDRGLRTVVWFRGPENVAVAVANAFIQNYAKMPAVTVVDPRYVFDVVDAAESLRGFLIVPDSLVEKDEVFGSAKRLAFAGSRPHNAVKIDVLPSNPSTDDYVALSYIVLSFYGFDVTLEDVDKLSRIASRYGEKHLLEVLDNSGYYGLKPAHLEASARER